MTIGDGFRAADGGAAAPPYTKGPYTFSEQITFQNAVVAGNPGNVWFVDSTNGSDTTNQGKSWADAFASIATAVDAAGSNGDTIYVAPGDYVISEAIDITTNNLKIIGPNKSCNDYSALVYSSAAIDIFTIDANNVSIVGLGISTVGGNGNGITIAGTTASYKCYIAHCRFDGYGKTGTGIKCDSTQDQPDLVVEHCLFREWSAAAIDHNATRAMYRYNLINVKAGGIGIDCKPTGGNRPDTWIYGNLILGSNSTDTGIKIASTEPTDGTLAIFNNTVTNCYLNITQDKSDAGVVNNGTSGNGSTPIIVDAQAA